MKKCPYCGKEYPDNASVCPLDGEPLDVNRNKITGVWRGVYGYGPREKLPGVVSAAFTLKLKQGWTSHFTGTVTDDAPQGTPGTGSIDGYFKLPTIEFTKQMPVGYVLKEDGTRITLREHLIELGHPVKQEVPALPILYQGTFLDANRVQGIWIIRPRTIPLPNQSVMRFPRLTGYWCAEFVSANHKDDPAGGPTAPLFDKSRLSPGELEEVEGVPLCSLGKYTVTDADKLIERLANAGILCRFSRDDSDMREMTPLAEVTGGYGGTAVLMEIFVDPEDEARAQEIINNDNPV